MIASRTVRTALLAALVSTPAFAQTGAESQGSILTFESQISLFDLGTNAASDIWGYVSPSGREYAVMNITAGTTFIEVTDPANPVVVARQAAEEEVLPVGGPASPAGAERPVVAERPLAAERPVVAVLPAEVASREPGS